MRRLKRLPHGIFGTAVALIALLAVSAGAARGAISDCIDATCRITASDGSRGTGCVFSLEQGCVYVLTAAHVVGSQDAVECEFWREGHQSQPLAARVIARSEATDTAVIALSQSALGGVLPRAVPLAPRGRAIRAGQALLSVGCAHGGWSTGWRGHALDCDRAELRFLPAPAEGRSGSAVFDAEGACIVGILRARTADGAEGIATPIEAVYRAFARPAAGSPPAAGASVAVPMQCGPNGCPAQAEPWQRHVLPYRSRHEQPKPAPPPSPWPSLSLETRPGVDVAPLDEKLGRIASLLEDLKTARPGDPVPAAPADPQRAAVDPQARKIAEAALGQVDDLKAKHDQQEKVLQDVKARHEEHEKIIQDVKAGTGRMQETVGGLSGAVDKLKESLAEDGTVSQRWHLRMDKVRTEMEKQLGHQASDHDVKLAAVKDLISEKISDGGLLGLAKILGLPAGLVMVIWLITRDVKNKRETGDPLAVEKLAALIEGKMGGLHERFEALKDRLQQALPGAATTSATTTTNTPAVKS